MGPLTKAILKVILWKELQSLDQSLVIAAAAHLYLLGTDLLFAEHQNVPKDKQN